jgi:peptidoglycan hydrolase-like amidase
MDRQTDITGRFEGKYCVEGNGLLYGGFSANVIDKSIVFYNAFHKEIARSQTVHCIADKGAFFSIANVMIGIDFHWERKEEQAFRGNLILRLRHDGTIAVINEINLEDYLESVVSSEMNSAAPKEFLKAHAILSRSWLLSALEQKKSVDNTIDTTGTTNNEEVIRWYDREDHDLYDVCADDHCQRYQGVTKIISAQAGEAVRETQGIVITYGDTICDARYSKACGGLTEDFEAAWSDEHISYLASISDAPVPHHPIRTEDDAVRWILSEPPAYCNTDDAHILENILPDFDRETKDFFRWTVQYKREELEQILMEKSGFDFGTLKAIIPMQRGHSGRISKLKIAGSKKSIIVGKELEIRRWLSRSHLYSSAFVVEVDTDAQGKVRQFRFHGAGWGHGVGLCQIGAAVMASKGFSAKEILLHYFPGTELLKIY